MVVGSQEWRSEQVSGGFSWSNINRLEDRLKCTRRPRRCLCPLVNAIIGDDAVRSNDPSLKCMTPCACQWRRLGSGESWRGLLRLVLATPHCLDGLRCSRHPFGVIVEQFELYKCKILHRITSRLAQRLKHPIGDEQRNLFGVETEILPGLFRIEPPGLVR